MRIVTLSDTHGYHWEIGKYNNPIPDGDVLVHCGDWQSYGKLEELYDFNKWLGTLPHKYKLVIAGNHDKAAWDTYKERTKVRFTNATYLQDEEIVIDGVKFYGFPWTPMFWNWHFMLDRGSEKMIRKCNQIPDHTDVLLSHGPPQGKLDWTERGPEHMGCEDLRNRVLEVQPQLHIFGHNHLPGITQNLHTIFVNTAICNERYEPKNQPQTFEIEKRV